MRIHDLSLERIAPLRMAARIAFLIAVLISGIALFYAEYEAIKSAFAQLDWRALVLVQMAAFAHIAASYGGWRALLRVKHRDSGLYRRMFFVGQLGKYLPGGIWSFLAVANFGKDVGVSTGKAMTASLGALLISVIVGAIMGAFVLSQIFPTIFTPTTSAAVAGLALACACTAALILPKLLGRWQSETSLSLLSPPEIAVSAAFCAITWMFGGVVLYAAGLGLGVPDLGVFTMGAIYAASWIIGFVFFVAPAGIGAREGAMVGLLATQMDWGAAVLIALVARITVTIADFSFGGFYLVRHRPKAAAKAAPLPYQE